MRAFLDTLIPWGNWWNGGMLIIAFFVILGFWYYYKRTKSRNLLTDVTPKSWTV